MNKKVTVSLVLLMSFISSLILGACGEQITPSGPTTGGQSTPTALVNANLPTVVSTSPVALPTSTLVPTQTPLPTATPLPAPTKLVLGDNNEPWGEITAYEVLPSDQLKDLQLNDDALTNLNTYFQYTPKLAASKTGSGLKPLVYILKILPKVVNGFTNGSLLPGQISSGVHGGYIENSNQPIIPPALLLVAARTGNPYIIVTAVVAVVIADVLIPLVISQSEKVTQGLAEIKNYLEQKDYAALVGNVNYLNSIKENLNQHKVNNADLETFRNQLETIERESFQSMNFVQTQMEKTAKSFKEAKLEGAILGIGNGGKTSEIQQILDTYKQQSNYYFTILSVKGLAAQIRSALPYSRDLATSRLEAVQKDLSGWYNMQTAFYADIERRLPEINKLLPDDTARQAILAQILLSKSNVSQTYKDADSKFSDTIQKVKAQAQDLSQPLLLVVQLDDQGKVMKTSKLIRA